MLQSTSELLGCRNYNGNLGITGNGEFPSVHSSGGPSLAQSPWAGAASKQCLKWRYSWSCGHLLPLMIKFSPCFSHSSSQKVWNSLCKNEYVNYAPQLEITSAPGWRCTLLALSTREGREGEEEGRACQCLYGQGRTAINWSFMLLREANLRGGFALFVLGIFSGFRNLENFCYFDSRKDSKNKKRHHCTEQLGTTQIIIVFAR